MLELAAERGVQWPLTTERLTLTPFTAQDAPAVWEFLQLEQVNTWTASSFTGPDDVAERWLPQGSQLVVRVGETVIGNCMIQVQDAWSHAEVTEQARGDAAALGLGSGSRVLSVRPYDDWTGVSRGLLAPLAAGGSVVLNRNAERMDAEKLAARKESEHITHTA